LRGGELAAHSCAHTLAETSLEWPS